MYSAGTGGIAIAPNGDLYVADTPGNRIWRIPARQAATSVPMSINPAGIVNGAKLVPRTVAVQSNTRFGPITTFESESEHVAPGELVAITGQCLGPLRETQGTVDVDGRVSTEVAGVQVFVEGAAVSLLVASPNQLLVQMPYETAGEAKAAVEVRYHGQRVNSTTDTSDASPGIFPVGNAVYSRGDTVTLRITGVGQTNPTGVTGQIAVGGARPLAAVDVKVGNTAAAMLSAEAEAGTIGVTRVTFRIPLEVAVGRTTITITAGGSVSSIRVQVS